MHRTIDSSQTHGTRPDSEGSMPSAGLCVRLLTSAFFYIYLLSVFLSSLFLHGLKRLKCVLTTQSWHSTHAHYTWGLLIQKLNINIFLGFMPHTCVILPHVPFSPLYASIWLKFWPSWVAWLLCLCPTFPLIRLGHKGRTSAIVTAGSAGCVPQTGWSRKLAFLREYSVGEQNMTFIYFNTLPPEVYSLRLFSQLGHAH